MRAAILSPRTTPQADCPAASTVAVTPARAWCRPVSRLPLQRLPRPAQIIYQLPSCEANQLMLFHLLRILEKKSNVYPPGG